MPEDRLRAQGPRAPGLQYLEAVQQLVEVVTDGLQHGHFGCTVSVKIGNRCRREVVIEAGKSHRFTVPEDEIPRLSWVRAAIPGTGTAEMQMNGDPEPSVGNRGRGSGTRPAQAGRGASYDDR